MAADALKVQILFSALDRLSGPLKAMKGGAGGLKGAVADAKRELVALERAQGKAGGYRKAERDLEQLGNALKVARLEARAAKLALDAAEKPTAALARAAEKAVAAEGKAGAAFQRQADKLERLGNEMREAGVDTARLAEHEQDLARGVTAATERLDRQTRALERNEAAQERAQKWADRGAAVSNAGMAMSLGVTLPAIAFAKTASDAANESAAALAQVEASLASMGPKAGRSIEQLQANAAKLQATSLFDDDDIMVKLTANLLTFGNVSGKVFDQAQQAAVDMSAKLGQDLQSSAMQLGKALNDPAKGVTALRKVGVSFSADQVKVIKRLSETGKTAEAQAIILKELENQFKGSAAAQRAADPMAASKENWRNFQENVGAIVNVLLPKLNAMLSSAMGWFNGLSPAMQTTVVQGVALLAALGPILFVVGKLTTGVALLSKGYMALRAAQAASAAAGAASSLAMGPLLIVVAIAAAIGVAAYLIWKHWDKIKAAFSAGAAAIGGAIARAAARVQELRGAFMAGLAYLGGLPGRFAVMGGQIIAGLIRGVLGKLGALRSTIVGAASSAAGWFKSKLGIRSPSRVFMGFGGNITEGLSRGIAAGTGSAVSRVDRLSTRVAGAFAASSLVASPAIAAPIGASSSPTSAASSPSSAAPGLTIGTVQINLTQQPGEDGAALARRLADELAKLGASNGRSSFEDD